jgi:hypothetical protein
VKDWPVRDAFKLHLKYSSEYAKKKSERRATVGVKKARFDGFGREYEKLMVSERPLQF